MSKVIDLYEFLLEAELHQYYSELKNDLKVSFKTLFTFNHNARNSDILCRVNNLTLFISGNDSISCQVCHRG